MNTKHTSGPWTAHPQHDARGQFLIRGEHPDGDSTRIVVASRICSRDVPVILAAPDLLAALEAMEEAAPPPKTIRQADAMNAARAAIAKATGR